MWENKEIPEQEAMQLLSELRKKKRQKETGIEGEKTDEKQISRDLSVPLYFSVCVS